jgi:16S rRNA (adenine1518-N6/adenine1519-N6)-dimethyltransferase
VPASAFRPRPRVESSFVTFVRREAGDPVAGDDSSSPGPLTADEYAAMDRLVRVAFGQRRKVLTNTLAGAARGGVTLSRDDVRGALERLGLSTAARPEELAPGQWARFARLIGWLPPAGPGDGGPPPSMEVKS